MQELDRVARAQRVLDQLRRRGKQPQNVASGAQLRQLLGADLGGLTEEAFRDLCVQAVSSQAVDLMQVPIAAFAQGLAGEGAARLRIDAAATAVAAAPELPAVDGTPVRVQVRNMAGDALASITEQMLPQLASTYSLTLHVLKATGNEGRWGKFLTMEAGELPAENWQSCIPQDAEETLELTLVVAALPVIDRENQELPETLEAIKARLEVPAVPVQTEAMMHLRKILSNENNPPIDPVLEAGLLPLALPLCEAEDTELRYEALWAMTNIASGTSAHCRALIDEGGLPRFMAALASPEQRIKEQATWLLGNIAGDSPAFRDLVIGAGAVPLLRETLLTSYGCLSLARNVAWTISNIFRGRPEPEPQDVEMLLQPLAQAVAANLDPEMMKDLLWALSYASDGADHKIQAVVNTGVVPHVVRALQSTDYGLVTPALRLIGNIATGNQEQTQAVIDAGALPCLRKLLESPKRQLRKEALWTLSNITAGTKEQVQAFLDEGLVPLVAAFLTGARTADISERKEAAFTFSNFCDGGTDEQVQALIEQRAVPAMLSAVDSADNERAKEAAVKGVLTLIGRMSKLDAALRSADWHLDELTDFVAKLESGAVEANLENLAVELEAAQSFIVQLQGGGAAEAAAEAEAVAEAQDGDGA